MRSLARLRLVAAEEETLKRGVVVLAALGALVGCGSIDHRGTAAPLGVTGARSCVGPQLSVTPAAAKAGDTVHASGQWFAADCFDTGQGGTSPPLSGLSIRVAQYGQRWTVATNVTASGGKFTFHVAIRLPHQLRPGLAAVVVPGYSAPVSVRIQT
jgi:hypothetical protein